MNERIKALIERAEYKAGKDTYSDWEVYVEPSREQIFEKFADLIVKECAKFLDENSGYDESNNAWHPEPEDLLQHFGVEE